MTESSNQGDGARGADCVSTPRVERPLGFLLKATEKPNIMEYGEGTKHINSSIYIKALRAHRGRLQFWCCFWCCSNPGWRGLLSCDQTHAARGQDIHCLTYELHYIDKTIPLSTWRSPARRCTHRRELWTCSPQSENHKMDKRMTSTWFTYTLTIYSVCIVLTQSQLCRKHATLPLAPSNPACMWTHRL